ncbi:MAG: hypothetical protein ACK502_10200 [Alphaproteobacteria bacterium]
MVTREFLSSAASAWRSAGCNFQRPEVYDAAVTIVAQTPDIKQLAAQLERGEQGRG